MSKNGEIFVLPREEVEEFFTFMDRDFDGNLTFEEFMGEESTIERLFKSMDTVGEDTPTGSGHLSERNFVTMVIKFLLGRAYVRNPKSGSKHS